jgi:hypothetical protein
MSELEPPADLNDRAAVGQWGAAVADHLSDAGMNDDAAAARQLASAAADASAEEIEQLVSESAVALMKASFVDLRDKYEALATGAEEVIVDTAEGSDERKTLDNAMAAYKVVAGLFDDALGAIEEGGPDAKDRLQAAVARAQERISELA